MTGRQETRSDGRSRPAKVLVLSRYSSMGASSRLRTRQYVRWLGEAGMDVHVASLFDDTYLTTMYATRRKPNVLPYYAGRVAQLMRARLADVLWIEKEALPWVPWFMERLLLPSNVPIVSDYDDAVFHRYDQHRNPFVRAALGGKIDRVMASSVLVTAGNEYLADRARAAGSEWVETIPTVVDVDSYHPAHDKLARDAVRIGWIGTPQTWAEYGAPRRDFFRDVADRTGAKFRLVGASLRPGTETPFEFVPWSEHDEVADIQQMDVGIMPLKDTPWERGKCGYKLIQYMACGLPVVASPVGVNRQIVEHGVNGFLAETDDEWQAALVRLCSDKDLRTRMGREGRRRVEAQYSIQVFGPQVARLFAGIAAGAIGPKMGFT